MGITSPLHGYPAEGLGGLTDGVSPLEMARAYATIANGGYRMKPIVVRKVTFPDRKPDNLGKPSRHKVFEDGVAYEATKILVKNVQGGTGTAAQIGCPVAGKTGTVDDYTDAWFVGYTPRLVTSVWVGHPKDPYPLGPGAAGGVVAAPIWGRYMKSAHGKFCGGFPKPKVPFAPQPFFGKYSRTGAKETKPDQQPGPTQPGSNPDGNGQGTTGKDGGGTQYPPDAYEAPPQGQPTTAQPPANTPPPAQDGGTGAPPAPG
jgi:penicillin-binding protein 1A